MAKNIKNQKTETKVAPAVGEVVSKTEQFFKKNQKLLIIGTCAVLVVAIGVMAVLQFYIKPLKKEAVNQTFFAEQYFRADNFETALNGDGNALGFAQIIDEYGAKAGQSVYLYAGICELKLGNAENAINYLKKYSTDDPIMGARALSCIGDAYSMLEKYDQAISEYEKAAHHADNEFAAAYLLKSGILYEETGKPEKALAIYKTIKEKYINTLEGSEIDKYISRITVQE